MFSLILSKIVGLESNLFGPILYLFLNSIIFYGVADSAIKKYQIAIVIIVGIGISIPFLNANGL